MSERADKDADKDKAQRVERLLGSVHEAIARLQRLGAELEREVARAPYQDGAPACAELATLELENARLKHAIEGRAVIEQAKGVIMARTGSSEQDAFGVLGQLARRENVSVRDAAAAVVDAGARPQPKGSSEIVRSISPAEAGEIRAALARLTPVGAQPSPAIQLSQLVVRNDDRPRADPGRRRWRLPNPAHATRRSTMLR